MARTRIKICGVKDVPTALAAADAGADAVGFVFVEDSPRFIKPSDAAGVMSSLPPFVDSVSLFQNPTLDDFMEAEQACPTTYTQLHGTEPVKLVQQCGPLLFKAVQFEASSIARELERWDRVDEVDAILVDGSPGGEGTAFDWAALARASVAINTPLILAGGLTPENVVEAIQTVRPYAVDVSSGVESSRGVKDVELIRTFCERVREADAVL